MPLETDVLAPFDPTSYSSISGAALFQLVSGVAPTTDKGMILVTTDVATVPEVPNAATTTKWQRYLWLRIMATGVKVYAWNPAAAVDVIYRQWSEITVSGIGLASITGAMIAPATITDSNIASLDYSKLVGAPTGSSPTGSAGGDLTGTYPNPSIKAEAIGTSQIQLEAITDDLVEAGGVASGIGVHRLMSSGVAGKVLQDSGTTGAWTTPKLIYNLADPTVAGDAYKLPAVKSTFDGYELITPATAVTRGLASTAVTYAGTTAMPSAGAAATLAHGLGAVPSFVRVVLVPNATDAATGWAVGDGEIDAHCFTGASQEQVFCIRATSTSIIVLRNSFVTFQIHHRTTGAVTSVTSAANFTVKVYARL